MGTLPLRWFNVIGLVLDLFGAVLMMVGLIPSRRRACFPQLPLASSRLPGPPHIPGHPVVCSREVIGLPSAQRSDLHRPSIGLAHWRTWFAVSPVPARESAAGEVLPRVRSSGRAHVCEVS
jgi:hypothetical protein